MWVVRMIIIYVELVTLNVLYAYKIRFNTDNIRPLNVFAWKNISFKSIYFNFNLRYNDEKYTFVQYIYIKQEIQS